MSHHALLFCPVLQLFHVCSALLPLVFAFNRQYLMRPPASPPPQPPLGRLTAILIFSRRRFARRRRSRAKSRTRSRSRPAAAAPQKPGSDRPFTTWRAAVRTRTKSSAGFDSCRARVALPPPTTTRTRFFARRFIFYRVLREILLSGAERRHRIQPPSHSVCIAS